MCSLHVALSLSLPTWLGPFLLQPCYVPGLSPHRNCGLEIDGLSFESKCVFPYTRTSEWSAFQHDNTWFMVLFLSLPINAPFCTQKQAEKEKCKMVQKPWLCLLAHVSLLLPGMSSPALVPVPQLPLDFSFFRFCCLFCLLNIQTVDIRHLLHPIDRLHIPFLQSLLNHVPNIILQDDYCRGRGKLLHQVLKRPTKIWYVMLIHDAILLMTCFVCSLNTGIRKQAQLPLDKAVPDVWKYEKHRLAFIGRTYIF